MWTKMQLFRIINVQLNDKKGIQESTRQLGIIFCECKCIFYYSLLQYKSNFVLTSNIVWVYSLLLHPLSPRTNRIFWAHWSIVRVDPKLVSCVTGYKCLKSFEFLCTVRAWGRSISLPVRAKTMHMLAFKELLWKTRALTCFSNNLSHSLTYGLTSLFWKVFYSTSCAVCCVLCGSEASRCLASRCHVDWHVLVGLN